MNSRLHLVVLGFNPDISYHQTKCQNLAENSGQWRFHLLSKILLQFANILSVLESVRLCLSSGLGLSAQSQLVAGESLSVQSWARWLATSDGRPGLLALMAGGWPMRGIFTWKSTLHPDNLRHPSSHAMCSGHTHTLQSHHNNCWHHS